MQHWFPNGTVNNYRWLLIGLWRQGFFSEGLGRVREKGRSEFKGYLKEDVHICAVLWHDVFNIPLDRGHKLKHPLEQDASWCHTSVDGSSQLTGYAHSLWVWEMKCKKSLKSCIHIKGVRQWLWWQQQPKPCSETSKIVKKGSYFVCLFVCLDDLPIKGTRKKFIFRGELFFLHKQNLTIMMWFTWE